MDKETEGEEMKTPPVWKRGTMYFEHRDEKVYRSEVDETPSMFMARIIRDLESKGANIWPYLLDEMEREQ